MKPKKNKFEKSERMFYHSKHQIGDWLNGVVEIRNLAQATSLELRVYVNGVMTLHILRMEERASA